MVFFLIKCVRNVNLHSLIAASMKEQLSTIGFEEKLDVINHLQKLNALLMSVMFMSPRAQYVQFMIVLKQDRHYSYNVTLWYICKTIPAVEMNSACCDTHHCQLYNSIECCTAMLLWQIYVVGKNKTRWFSCQMPDVALKQNICLLVAIFRYAVWLNRL